MECEDLVCLCTAIKSHAPAALFELEPLVVLKMSDLRRLTSQDCSPPETVEVEWERRRGPVRPFAVHTPGPGSTTTSVGLAAGPPSAVAQLRITCPLRTNVATSVTLAGPRLDARATPAELSALLTGRFVAVGAVVRTPAGEEYLVTSIETGHGRGGIALVRGSCRIRINDAQGPSIAPPTQGLVGLLDEQQAVAVVFSAAASNPGRQFGALVHGPRGCGVHSLVCVALAAATAAKGSCQVVQWSPSMDAALVRHRCRCAVIALVVPSCERYLGSDGEGGEGAVAALTVRRLQSDLRALTHGGGAAGNYNPAVVVVAFTHAFAAMSSGLAGGPLQQLFPCIVSVTPPGAADRAALLSRWRGVPAAECMDEAHALVGRTRAEVVAAGRAPRAEYRPPFKPVRWADIGGLEEVKGRLHRVLVWPQQHPEAFAHFNLTPPRGILLYGPPGCAKTTLVKALCSEGYFSLIYLDSATVVSAYVGESERQLRAVFARAAQQAPCIVFFDEVEVIGARREAGDGGRGAEGVRLLSTLLTEMDGFAAARGVCFIGATNVPHLIDDALLRPGRFDYLVHVPLPAHADRRQILSLFLHRTAADADRLAAATEGFSGADLTALCTIALLDLGGSDAAEAPPCLQDEAWATDYFVDRARQFKCTDYDAAALRKFQLAHAEDV